MIKVKPFKYIHYSDLHSMAVFSVIAIIPSPQFYNCLSHGEILYYLLSLAYQLWAIISMVMILIIKKIVFLKEEIYLGAYVSKNCKKSDNLGQGFYERKKLTNKI